MKAEKLFEKLEESFPLSLAMSFDHPGLMAGRSGGDIETVYVAVDATGEVIEKAKKADADLILTHHPMGLSGLRHVNDQDFIGRRVVDLIENGMRHYAMHTNYDAVRMGRVAGERLHLQQMEILIPCEADPDAGIGVTGCRAPMTLYAWGKLVKEGFDLPGVRIYGDRDRVIEKAGVIPGSGKGEADAALNRGCGVLITGDVGHHDGLDAVEKGLSVIDAGHYGLEKVFVPDMALWLKTQYPELKVVTDDSKSPFEIV